jgi:hypothetical protein
MEKGKEFFRHYSEKDLESVLLFPGDPKDNFKSIQSIPDLGPYIGIYEDYLTTGSGHSQSVALTFLDRHFKTLDAGNLPVLTFLLLHTGGINGYVFYSAYTRFFESHSALFLRDLKERANWKEIVDALGLGDLIAFRNGVDKLGDSKFEKEFRDYASKKWNFKDLPIIVPENAVTFIALTEGDAKLAVTKGDQLIDRTSQLLSDFHRSSNRLAHILKKMGIGVKYGTSRDIWFQFAGGEMSKFALNQGSFFGMGLFPKGRQPVLITDFPPNFDNMARIICEYFQVEIKRN